VAPEPLLNKEPLSAVNKILIEDIKILLSPRGGGFKYTPRDILYNKTFANLVATYVYINGPGSWLELGTELGLDLYEEAGVPRMTGGRRRKSRKSRKVRR
jgi:hypothetical protein